MEISIKTIENDEAYLRQISKEIDFQDKSYLEDIAYLTAAVSEIPCFALAAVQVGIPRRLLYLRSTTDNMEKYADEDYNEARVLINPRVTFREGHTQYWEACVSCLTNTGLVDRPYRMGLQYYDENGALHEEVIEGFPVTVISHELDHLDGILHMDIA